MHRCNSARFSSDLLTNPDTGLLNMQGKNALGKGQVYTQQFDAQAEQIAMTLPEGARAGFMQQAQQQRHSVHYPGWSA